MGTGLTVRMTVYRRMGRRSFMSRADVFISYKSEEEPVARHIREVLEANGISCWMAPDSIPVGSNYMKQIPEAIENCRAMVVVISRKSQQSVWVKNEFSEAISKHKLIIPYVIQDCELEDEFAFSMSTMQQVFAWKDEEQALKKIVHDIREALGKEDSAKVEIRVVRKNKYLPAILIAAVVCVLIAALFLVPKKSQPAETAASPAQAAAVYYSEALPYVLTGYYATASDAQNANMNIPFCEKAVSLLSFIRNDSDKPVFVEKISCDFADVTPVEEPVIGTDGILEDGRIQVIAFNDGWGDADEVRASWHLKNEEGVPEFSGLSESLTGSSVLSIESGSAQSVLDITPDFVPVLEWARAQNMEYMRVLFTFVSELKWQDQNAVTALYLMYDPKTDTMFADYGGFDEDRPVITLYGVLDVDNPPASIRFPTGDATPLVEDTFRIETVIIPTKSCQISMKGSYLIGGEPYETEVYEVKVQVPYFADNSYIVGGPLTRALAGIDMNDRAQVKRICDSYRYDIESILPDDAPRG